MIPGYETKTFMHISETVWDNTMGDPRSGGVFLSSKGAFDHSGKLHGKYSWSFKIELPKELEALDRKGRKPRIISSLPPSLRGSHGQVRIGYEVIVKLKRPGLRFGNR